MKAGTSDPNPLEASERVAVDMQFSRVLAERETILIRRSVQEYQAGKMTPEKALAAWASMAEIAQIEAQLEREARKAIYEVEQEVNNG